MTSGSSGWERPAPSPTQCCMRATCSTHTAGRRARINRVGSLAFWVRRGSRSRPGRRRRHRGQFLVNDAQAISLVVRFLQLQHRRAERELPGGGFQPVDELTTSSGSWLTWDEAFECECPSAL